MVDPNKNVDLTGFREDTARDASTRSEKKKRRKKKHSSSPKDAENRGDESDATPDGASGHMRVKSKNSSRKNKSDRLSFQSADAFVDEVDSGHKRTKRRNSSPKKKPDRTSFTSTDAFADEVDSGHKRTKRRNSSTRRNSFGSVNSRKKRDSITSIGSGGFLNRLDTSLVTSVEFSIDESQDFKVIDVEEVIELNREREMKREKRKKKIKNQRKSVDPRLFPSYYNDKSENNEEDDESSMGDYAGDSHHNRSRNGSMRSHHQIGNGSTRSNHQIVSAVQGRKIVQLSVILSPARLQGGNIKEKKAKFGKMLKSARTDGVVRGIRPHKDLASFSAPIDLLEIENGRAILVRGNGDKIRKSKISMSVAAVKQTMAPQESDALFLHTHDDGKGNSLRKRISNGDIRDFKAAKSERDTTASQIKLRRSLVWSMDVINSQNFGRQIQVLIPFLTGYEAYLLGQIVEVLDSVVSSSDASRKTKRRIRRKAKVELNELLMFAFKNNNASHIITENLSRRFEFSSHMFQRVRKYRWYDIWAQIPMVGTVKLPITENFPPNELIADLINESWAVDPEKIIAQHYDVDCNGYEAENRNQFGTYIGRSKTNDFRIAHRLSVDESILHAFVISPMSTMINNGVVHVLRIMAKHWQNILAQPFGNFAHHRLEQIDPFETMRFHMPNVCIVLSSLRGRNRWDARVLGPFIRKCQILTTSYTAKECLNLAKEMQSTIVHDLCAGIASIEEPLSRWLDAIKESCQLIEAEAKAVYKEVTGVEIGLQFGHDLITQVSWKLPSDEELEKALLLHLHGKYAGEIVQERNIRRALLAVTPRDKRTLTEIVRLNIQESQTGRILVERAKHLLKRVIRREFLNDAIRELSTGEQVYQEDLMINDWYWLTDENDKKAVYIFEEEGIEENENLVYHFLHVDSGVEKTITFDEVEDMKCRRYIPVAMSIVRAQRCYMNLELDFCHRFKYSAFAEFAFLRTALNRLSIVSQLFCEELDDARINMLKEIKATNQVNIEVEDLEMGNTYYIYNSTYDIYAPFVCKKKYTPADPEWKKLQQVELKKISPQSTIVIGSGITGLMTVIHCTENVLSSGGEMKLYETFDANTTPKGNLMFERSQIVRLDSRWVAMLRYHLGTTFEDIFIPTMIESNTQLGNNLVTQGFVEITMKDLECVLHAEVTKYLSNEVIQVCLGKKMRYDTESNSIIKFGKHLEVGDKILRRVNPMGKPCKEFHRWTIADVQNAEIVGVGDLSIGEEYDIYDEQENIATPFKLTEVDLETMTYKFESLKKKINDIEAKAQDLPLIYPRGSKRHFKTVLVKCDTKGDSEDFHCDRLSKSLKGKKFIVDIGYSHVVECAGKPEASLNHFQVTSSEPYGFCCVSRLNRLMRDEGNLDGFHAIKEQDNEYPCDTITMVRQLFIAKEMASLISTENWQRHFITVIEDSKFPSLNNDKDPIVKKLMEAVEWHSGHASSFRRQTLQIKISETIDNLYLAMELTREYEKWKFKTVNRLLSPIEKEDLEEEEEDNKTRQALKRKKQHIEDLKETLRYNIDVLWFEACLEVLRQSGVYNKGSLKRIARLHLINSHAVEELKNLSVGDSFRASEKTKRRFEILFMSKTEVLARTIDGLIQKFDPEIEVYREGCLSRSSDGDAESHVAVATFPVSQLVHHRSMYQNNLSKGYVFASIGEEQATSHFMHYTALSGGCIHAMQFNQFVRSTIDGDGVTVSECLQSYAQKINWSNGETIQRGIMASFGEDAFLRPGFSYREGLKYIYSQMIGSNQEHDDFLSGDWKRILAASMIPRGMELNDEFAKALKTEIDQITFELFLEGIKNDEAITWSNELEDSLKTRKHDISSLISNPKNKKTQQTYWDRFFGGLTTSLDDAGQNRVQNFHGRVVKGVEQGVQEVINFARKGHLCDQRPSQEFWNQPKPVDSIVDDFAADAQSLPNFLAQSVAFCAASVALTLYSYYPLEYLKGSFFEKLFDICGVIISILNISLCLKPLSTSRRYKVRNTHVCALYLNKKFLDLKKAIYKAMDANDRKDYFEGDSPFLEDLETKKKRFMEDIEYYGLDEPDEFVYDYSRLLEQIDEPNAFERFQKALVTYHIPNVYQTNSYVQDRLVEIYKACDEFREFLSQNKDDRFSRENKQNIPHLFARVSKFGPRLKKSLDSKILNLDFFLAIRYFWSFRCFSWSSTEIKISSIESETYGIIKETRVVSNVYEGSIPRHQIQDLEYLHRALLETDKGSLVFLWTMLLFIVSWIYVIARLVFLFSEDESALTTFGFWSQLTMLLPGLLSLLYFLRCLSHLFWLFIKVGANKRSKNVDSNTRKGLRKIKSFIFLYFLMMTARICALLLSMVALTWCVAANALKFDPLKFEIPTNLRAGHFLPLYIAVGAFFLEIGTTMLFVLVEFTTGYNLPTKLGEVICESFREEIESMHKALSIPENKFNTKQFQTRTVWEYVAREFLHKYRFDVVFRPDRFGSILQYLQSGMEKRDEISNGDVI